MSLDVNAVALRTLVVIGRTGSFTTAAESLGYTQSAVSKQMRSLEAAVGADLFERGARGVSLTSAGRIVVGRAVLVLDQLDVMEREVSDLGGGIEGRVRLGGFPTTAMGLVPRAIALVRKDFPDITVDFEESSTAVQIRRLRAGRLDLALIATGEDLPGYDLQGIAVRRLPSGTLRVACGEGHPFAARRRVGIDDLRDQSWIGAHASPGEPQFGPWPTLEDPRVAVRGRDWATRLAFVAADLGLTTIPSLIIDALPPGVVAIGVDDAGSSERHLGLAWIGKVPPAARPVVEALTVEARRIAEMA